jgi:hypothetical protein
MDPAEEGDDDDVTYEYRRGGMPMPGEYCPPLARFSMLPSEDSDPLNPDESPIWPVPQV